jgi:WD40 repeat protein
LLATWEARRGRTFTLDGYRASGGVRGAIAETAESVFTDQLNQQQQELAHDVFLRLTELGEGTEDTRRRAALNELVRQAVEATQLRIVLNILAEARLITLNEDSAEVAHEALIREWQRLHQWLTQDREGLHLHRHLTESAKEWESLGSDASELYRGARLAQAYEWADANKNHLNEAERAFLTASLEQEQHEELEREAQRQRELAAARQLAEEQKQRAEEQANASRQLRRRAVWLTGAFVLTLITSILAGILANRNATLAVQNAVIAKTAQAAQAEAQSNFIRAEAQRLAAEANALLRSNGSSELIALLSLRSLNIQYSPQAEAALDGAARLNYPRKLFIGHTGAVTNVGFAFDGKYILTTSLDNTFRLWDAQSGEELHQFGDNSGSIPWMAISPDGHFALTTLNNSSRVSILNIKTPEFSQAFINPGGVPNIAVFSQDGKFVFTGAASVVRAIDIQSENVVRSFFLPDPAELVIGISPDGKFAIATSTTEQNTVQMWSLDDTVTKIKDFAYDATISGTPQRVAISPNGQSVLIGYIGGDVVLWDIATGNSIQIFKGHSTDVGSVAFSPDGKSVLTGGSDKTVRLWDVRTGNELLLLSTTDNVDAVAFSPDGQSILTGGADGAVELWDIHHPPETSLFQEGYTDSRSVSLSAVAFSPDGKFLATGGTDGLKLWNTTTGQLQHAFVDSGFIKYGVRFSTDGKYVFSGDWSSGVISQWNIQTGERLQQFTASFFLNSTAKLNDMAISPDGRSIIANGSLPFTNQVLLWDTQADQQTGRLFFEIPNGYLTNLAFSPDGKLILTANTNGQVRVMDAQVGMLLKLFIGTQGINSAAFSPDGKYIATAGVDKLAHLWEFETGKEIRQFNGHTDILYRVIFSPDGKFLATSSADGTARLWDVQTGQKLRRFTGHTAGVQNVAFSPDGKYVVTVSGDGTARLWNVDYHTTMQYLCSTLLRDFTDEEHSQYGITDYEPTCPKQ